MWSKKLTDDENIFVNETLQFIANHGWSAMITEVAAKMLKLSNKCPQVDFARRKAFIWFATHKDWQINKDNKKNNISYYDIDLKFAMGEMAMRV
jgi:hypothetical protein